MPTVPRPDTSDMPQCVDCGCCCFSHMPDYLRVMGVDYDRLGDDAEKWVTFIGNRAYMRMVDGHCGALRFDAKSEQYLCSIYERRPDVCRWLERGSGNCRGERSEKADRPIKLRVRSTSST